MTLRKKVFLILFSVVLLFVLVEYGILRHVILPGFVDLEQAEARKDMERCVQAIHREVHHLDSLCHDWAAWDDTYEFILDRNSEYLEANLVLSTFTDNGLNLIYLYNSQREVVWGENRDLETEEQVMISEFSSSTLPKSHPLLAYEIEDEPLEDISVSGIFMTSRGPYLISSRPVLNSENEGPVRGFLIMGRLLNDDIIESLKEQTRVEFRFWTPSDKSISAEDKRFFSKITSDNLFHVEARNSNLLHVYTTLPDIKGVQGLLLRADVPRNITAKGRTITRFAWISTLGGGLIVLVALLLTLQAFVLEPIIQLTNHVIGIGKTKDLSERLTISSQDEIGTLGQEFNAMADKLTSARNRLLEQSYYSGFAEMASGILHNIRNILNPIAGRLGMVRKKISDAPLENMDQANAELDAGGLEAGREKSLMRYIRLGSARLTSLVRETDDQLKAFSDYIRQIEEILAEKDQYSHAERAVEPLHLEEIIREAATLMPQELQNATDIQIDPGIAMQPKVLAERVVLRQVITNLLNNAAEAILRTDKSSGRIRIKADIEGKDDFKVVHAEIRDNGEGIDQVTLARIFDRGFSKKELKQTGIGLHWCANVISAMDGSIYAESDGVGQGACFHLKIPVSS